MSANRFTRAVHGLSKVIGGDRTFIRSPLFNTALTLNLDIAARAQIRRHIAGWKTPEYWRYPPKLDIVFLDWAAIVKEQVVHKDLDFFGDSLRQELSPLHQISPRPNEILRFACLDEFCKPKASPYHWYRDGFYRCNTRPDRADAPCCEQVKQSWTCVRLALVYLNADVNGKITRNTNIKFRVGYVSLARTPLSELLDCHKDAPGCDVLYSNDGGYHIRGASRDPVWKRSPQAAEVELQARKWGDGKKLIEKLGKKLTDEEWRRLLTTGSTFEMDGWD